MVLRILKNVNLLFFVFFLSIFFNSLKSFAETPSISKEKEKMLLKWMSDRRAENRFDGMMNIICVAYVTGDISNSKKVKLLNASEFLSFPTHSNPEKAKKKIFTKYKNNLPKCFPELQ